MGGNKYTDYYEFIYDNKHFKYLEFIRLDMICETSYITLKNIITGEMYTFEEARIRRITKRIFHPASYKNKHYQKVAN